jgi:predicted DNA-binding protein (MmcQ/YjbR family)
VTAPTFDDVRRICLGLPEAEEVFVDAWGHPTFRVRNKMFASMGGEESERSCTFKTEPEEREALDAQGEPWFVPAYVGRYGWRGLHLHHPGAAMVSLDELTELLTTSWRLTAPKRLVRSFDEGRTPPP